MLIIVAFSLYDYFSSRSWQMVTSKERNETVFENRNKEYGAYKIRKDYDKRIILIFLGVTVGIGALWGASNLFKPLEKEREIVLTTDNITQLFKDEKPVEIPEPEKIEEPAAPSKAEIAEFREFEITDQEIDNKITPPDPDKAIGLKDQKGDPDVDPFDPTKITDTKGKGDGDIIKKKDDDKIHEVLDEAALYPGGMNALRAFIAENIDINAIDGTAKVYLKFVVDTDGSISSVIVTKTTEDCKSCEKAAIKVVKSMPKWTPGKVNGEAVKSYYRLPINIQ
jgi:protein TonB